MANPEHAQWLWACQDAATILRSVLSWNLTPTRWEQVREVLTAMGAAAAASAPAALRDASETLELYMPVRVEARLGDEPRGPVPSGVRDQIAELVDTLQPGGVKGPGGAGLPGGSGQPARHGT